MAEFARVAVVRDGSVVTVEHMFLHDRVPARSFSGKPMKGPETPKKPSEHPRGAQGPCRNSKSVIKISTIVGWVFPRGCRHPGPPRKEARL